MRARDQQIAELTLKVATLKDVLVDAQHHAAGPIPHRHAAREPKTAASERHGYEESTRDSAEDGFIDIAFGH